MNSPSFTLILSSPGFNPGRIEGPAPSASSGQALSLPEDGQKKGPDVAIRARAILREAGPAPDLIQGQPRT